jgi:hypothetical protein
MTLKDEVIDLLAPTVTPLRALAVTILGVYLAGRWYDDDGWTVGLYVLAALVVAYGFFYGGRSVLYRAPKLGLALMEVWVLAPLTVAAVAAGGTVVLGIEFAVPDNAPAVQKEMVGTLSTAISVFLSSSFVAWTEDQDASRLASRIQQAFYASFQRVPDTGDCPPRVTCVEAGSAAEQLVYSRVFRGLSGWDFHTRWKRSEGLATELQSLS